jgi:hypothetical protein
MAHNTRRRNTKRLNTKRHKTHKKVKRKLRKTYKVKKGGKKTRWADEEAAEAAEDVAEFRRQQELQEAAKNANSLPYEEQLRIDREREQAEKERKRINRENKKTAKAESNAIENTVVNYGNKTIDFSELRTSINAKFEFTSFKKIYSVEFLSATVSNLEKYKIIKIVYKTLNDNQDDIYSYALLKCNNKRYRDSVIKSSQLLYEYFVGLLINELYMKYPCFLETYNFYIRNTATGRYTGNGDLEYMDSSKISNFFAIGTKNNNPIDIKNILVDEKTIVGGKYDTCNGTENGILIQYLPTYVDFVNAGSGFKEIVGLLYQLYKPLAALAGIFEHNNLTLDQVILYTPYGDRYIQFNYGSGDEIISFKSKYMLKIKNYSSCFFKKDEDLNSDKIVDYVNTKCSAAGMKKPVKTNTDINFLQLLLQNQELIEKYKLKPILDVLIENSQEEGATIPDIINLVDTLEDAILDGKQKNDNLYANSTKFCDLNIPLDGNMTIVLNQN